MFCRAGIEFLVLVKAYSQRNVEADEERRLAIEVCVDAGGQPSFVTDQRLFEGEMAARVHRGKQAEADAHGLIEGGMHPGHFACGLVDPHCSLHLFDRVFVSAVGLRMWIAGEVNSYYGAAAFHDPSRVAEADNG